ncbi:NUDIX hydrolase [Swingsia samuiensis]|uniref:NUDIX domain-containing protein n=1 Tax=Swingsia samuiensis TaxID=1293412 RepID=A0A4Y6UIN8_9PROT|nr:NUDIX domain-containing protein [Swingsia samuiensis]QDH16227.1 NUDIX domain-containing protein [Swingsia samuiensis]
MIDSTLLPFIQHIKACKSANLPGKYIPLSYHEKIIGWIAPQYSSFLTQLGYLQSGTGFHITSGHQLLSLSNNLAELNAYKPHNELFDVRAQKDVVIGQVDRGAIPILGLNAEGIHLNGLVKQGDKLMLWVAKRSMNKRLDPGKLDHLVAGGMSTGLTPNLTVLKEAQEEAGIPPELAQQAKHVSTLHYALERPEGLRRDLLHCYDLILPESFTPIAEDGEVESFSLLPIQDVFQIVKNTNDFKFNVNLVLIDLFIRHNLFNSKEKATLSNLLNE